MSESALQIQASPYLGVLGLSMPRQYKSHYLTQILKQKCERTISLAYTNLKAKVRKENLTFLHNLKAKVRKKPSLEA